MNDLLEFDEKKKPKTTEHTYYPINDMNGWLLGCREGERERFIRWFKGLDYCPFCGEFIRFDCTWEARV